MLELQHPGRYRGQLADWGVCCTENGCIQFRATCVGEAFKAEGVSRFEDLAAPVSLMAFINLTRKDGVPIPQQVDALKKALGWDGKLLRDLQEGDYSETPISFVVTENEYEGNVRLSVDWINPVGASRRSTEAELTSLDGQWRSLRQEQSANKAPPATPQADPASNVSDDDIPF